MKILLVILCCALPAMGRSLSDSELAFGPRALGMGGAYSAVADDAYALFWNSAGLARAQGAELAWSQERFAFDARGYSVALRMRNFSLGWLQVTRENVVNTQIVLDSNGNPVIDPMTNQPRQQILGFYNQATNQLLLGAGFALGEHVNVGGALRGQLLSMAAGSEFQMAGDLGLQMRWGALQCGMGVQRLGSLLSVARVGMAWTVFKTESDEFSWQGRQLVLSEDVAATFAHPDEVLAFSGVEWTLAKPLIFRLGWNSKELTFGASLIFSKFQVDYAAIPGNIYEANRVAIIAKF